MKRNAGQPSHGPPAGDPYDPSELVPGVVVFMDSGIILKMMEDKLNVPCFSCDGRYAVNGCANFMCVERCETSHRTFWAPLHSRTDAKNAAAIEAQCLRGHQRFVSTYQAFHKDQVWACDDETVDAASRGRDLSHRGRRNFVDPPITVEEFDTVARRWVKLARAPKKAEVVQTLRDPLNATALFKGWVASDLGLQNATMQKVQKAIRNEIRATYPTLSAAHAHDILGDIMVVSSTNNTTILIRIRSRDAVFFRHNDGPWIPTLRIIHSYPWIIPGHQVDIGGCRFIMGGADLMCPGLTSPGGRIAEGVEVGRPVAVYVEGKTCAAAVGVALMSSSEIREKNRGHCVRNMHYLGDGLWTNGTSL